MPNFNEAPTPIKRPTPNGGPSPMKKPTSNGGAGNMQGMNGAGAKQGISPFPKRATYDANGNLNIRMVGILNPTADVLNQNSDGSFVVKKTDKNAFLKLIQVAPNDVQKFLKSGVSNIVSTLQSVGGYDNNALKKLPSKFENIVDGAPTPDEINNQNVQIAKTWEEMLQKIQQDPEIRKRFLAFQTLSKYAAEYGFSTLSRANVTHILSVDPKATFMTQKHQWENSWNRSVQPGAPFVICNVLEDRDIPLKILNAKAVELGYKNFNDLTSKTGRQSQEALEVKKRATRELNLPPSFYKAKFYDVRFTTPNDPNNDPWMKLAGVVNNLSGELNDVAKKKAIGIAQAKGEEAPDFDAKPATPGNDPALLTRLVNFIEKRCYGMKINPSKTGNAMYDLCNNILSIGNMEAVKRNILDSKKNVFASALLVSIAASFDLQNSPEITKAMAVVSGADKGEISNIAGAVHEVYSTLCGNALNEEEAMDGEVAPTPTDPMDETEVENYLLSLANGENRVENVKNEFNSLMERINNVGKTLI